MPVDVPKTPGKSAAPKGKGGIMHAKIAGLPVPVVIGGVVVAILIGLYFKNKSAAASTAAGGTAAPTDTTGAGTGGSGSTTDQTPIDTSQLEADIGTLGGILGTTPSWVTDFETALSTAPTAPTAPTTPATPTTPAGVTTPASATGGSAAVPTQKQVAAVTAANPTLAGITDYLTPANAQTKVIAESPVAASASNPVGFATSALAKTQAQAALGQTAAFGGVTNISTNRTTGVVTTTYASGRVVQQAPGKSAYVAKK